MVYFIRTKSGCEGKKTPSFQLFCVKRPTNKRHVVIWTVLKKQKGGWGNQLLSCGELDKIPSNTNEVCMELEGKRGGWLCVCLCVCEKLSLLIEVEKLIIHMCHRLSEKSTPRNWLTYFSSRVRRKCREFLN